MGDSGRDGPTSKSRLSFFEDEAILCFLQSSRCNSFPSDLRGAKKRKFIPIGDIFVVAAAHLMADLLADRVPQILGALLETP